MLKWSVVIPSATARNLDRSARSVLRTHPGVDPARIVVVDDGAGSGQEGLLPVGMTWVRGAKPFVFARNVNLGIRACPPDHIPILMNDDAEMLSLGGFETLLETLKGHPQLGVLSAGIQGHVGKQHQEVAPRHQLVAPVESLAFVCVALRRSTWDRVGKLDERFTGYGFEDDDYCLRARSSGFSLGVQHRCVVRHDGSIPSSFRTRPDYSRLFEHNRTLWHRKWPLEASAK